MSWLSVGSLLLVCLISIAGPVTKIRGAEWTSPDGVIKVTEPDAAKVQRVENPPQPFLALWMSPDETLRLGVMRTPLPAGQKLDRTAADEGFAQELSGSVTSATTTTSNDHEIWITTVSGSSAGTKVTATQAIVRVDDTVYKVMAMSLGDGLVDEATIKPFLESIQVTGPPHPGGVAGNSSSNNTASADESSDDPFQRVSYLLGRAVGFVIMLLLVVWVVSLFTRKPSRQPPPIPPGQQGPPR